MRVIVLIPAAGLGTRMQTGRPGTGKSKQFFELDGTPILIHTLRRFGPHPKVAQIIVALRQNEINPFWEMLSAEPFCERVKLVAGGENRQESVFNALQAAKAEPDDVVLVHDAVRPFVTAMMIDNVITAIEKHGAAIVGLPAVDTIKMVERTAEGAIITSTVPRERVVQAQTPQGARYSILKQAFDEARADTFTGTDEASLVERLGHEVVVVMGSQRNIKITTPSDMELAELFLKTNRG